MISVLGDAATERPRLDASESVAASRSAPTLCAIAFAATDCCALAASIGVALAAEMVWASNANSWRGPEGHLFALLFAALFPAIVAYLASKGRYSDRVPFWSDLRLVARASWCTGLTLAAFSLAAGILAQLLPALAVLALFPLAATIANRMAKRLLVSYGLWTLNVLVVGAGQVAADMEAALASDPLLGYRVIRRVDPAAALGSHEASSLATLLSRHGARRLLLALDADHELRPQFIAAAVRDRISFATAPQPAKCLAASAEAMSFLSHDAVLMAIRDELSQPISRTIKAAGDVALAMVLLVIASPLFLVIAIANLIEGGPILFAHRRVGAGGRPFHCLKFRSMRVDGDRVLAEALAADPALAAEWAATCKLRNDPRVTSLGAFLRKTSLDEIPQLLNVLRLDMSLVGPRPIVESEVPLYGRNIAEYYAARPGLTGLWQVSGRSDTSYARRVQLDAWYVNNWTIWNDIAVLLKTIPAVLVREGAR